MLTISNDQLSTLPDLTPTITCPRCGSQHTIKYSSKVMPDGTLVPSTILAYYKCSGIPYLAGVDNKNVISILEPPTVMPSTLEPSNG